MVVTWGHHVSMIRCDGCGAELRFMPLTVWRAREARRLAEEKRGWHCWNPASGQESRAPVPKDHDYCPQCGPGGGVEYK